MSACSTLGSSKKLSLPLISLGNVSWISYGSGILQCLTGYQAECPELQPQVVLLLIPQGQKCCGDREVGSEES